MNLAVYLFPSAQLLYRYSIRQLHTVYTEGVLAEVNTFADTTQHGATIKYSKFGFQNKCES
jgi:hypothetical protein